MALSRLVIEILCVALVDAIVLEHVNLNSNSSDKVKSGPVTNEESDLNNAFNGVYTECLMHLSYTCLQRKTLLYIKELDGLREISVIGDYVKFGKDDFRTKQLTLSVQNTNCDIEFLVKLNNTEDKRQDVEEPSTKTAEELSSLIDKAVDNFFNNHLIRFSALGKDIVVPHTVEEFVGRKRRKGGGGGHGGGDDGGKKKMMMMAMMCMKMKLMMMVPAMMGMMGMMSFKGMMFSMMTFMISKMMLLMKILEKKGGGGGGGGAGDGSWATGGGGGAWMPAGGQDYGGGGGYDSNAQWSSRSILEKDGKQKIDVKPVVTYIKPVVTYNNPNDAKPFNAFKKLKDAVTKANNKVDEPKSRRKRGIMDALQNAYLYWTTKILGLGYKQKRVNHPKYKIINGIKYMYYPVRPLQKVKTPKELPVNNVKTIEDTKPIVITDFNKGEIVEARMNRRKIQKINENVNETVDDNPWE